MVKDSSFVPWRLGPQVHFVAGSHWLPPPEVCDGLATKVWTIELSVSFPPPAPGSYGADIPSGEPNNPTALNGVYTLDVTAGTRADDDRTAGGVVETNLPGWLSIREALQRKRHFVTGPGNTAQDLLPRGWAGGKIYKSIDIGSTPTHPYPTDNVLAGGAIWVEVAVGPWRPAYYIPGGATISPGSGAWSPVAGSWPGGAGLEPVWYFYVEARAFARRKVWVPATMDPFFPQPEDELVAETKLVDGGAGYGVVGYEDFAGDGGVSDNALKISFSGGAKMAAV